MQKIKRVSAKKTVKKPEINEAHNLIKETAFKLNQYLLNASGAGIPNFHFEIKIPDNVLLTLIDIDGIRIEGQELFDLSAAAQDRLIKGDKFVPLAIDSIYLEIDAKGEAGNEVSGIKLSYHGKAVILPKDKFKIKSNKRGLYLEEDIALPTL